jgi:hypothetical protein
MALGEPPWVLGTGAGMVRGSVGVPVRAGVEQRRPQAERAAGKGLASWPEYGKTKQGMYLDVPSQAGPEQHRARYEFLGSR